MSFSNEIADVEGLKKAFDGLDGSLNRNATDLLKLIKVYEDLNKISQSCEKTTENLGKSQKATADAAKQKEAIDKQIITTTQKVTQTEEEAVKVMIKKRLTTAESTKEITLQTKAELASIGSKQKLIAETAILENQLNKVNLTTKEGVKEAERLRAAIDKNNVTIKENSSALGAQKINIGNYKSAFTGLIDQFKAGEIGAGGLVKGVLSIGKAFIVAIVTNPVLLAIAAIVGALYALGSVFTSTASGARVVKEVMAEMGAIVDVLKQRLIVVIDAFKAVFSGEWKKAGDLFSESVAGMGDQMGQAVTEAKALTDAQLDLNKELALHIAEEAKEENQIQKLIFLSKDRTKSDKERLDAIREAMKLSKEKAEREEFYAQRQLEIYIRTAVLQAKETGLTKEQLTAFLQLNTAEQYAALQTEEVFKKMYNIIGKDGITILTEAQAKATQANTSFFEGNKRNQSLMTGFEESLKAEREQRAKDAFDKRVKAVEMADLKEKELINKKHIDGITDEKGYQAELINQEKLFLNAKQALYKPESKEYQDIELQKQAITIKSQDDILKAIEERFKQQKAIEEQGDKNLEDLLKGQKAEEDKFIDDSLKNGEKVWDEKKKLDDDLKKTKIQNAKDVRDASIDLARDSINAVFEMQNMKLEKEMSDLEKKKEKELSNKNLTESQKLKIEADFDKKANAIKSKQAQQAKMQALFDIAIGTAVSVMNAKGNVPLMIILAAMGAVQAALVAARPIPKYAKGTQSAEREGIFGEAGLEVMFPKGGGAIFADKPTYFHGDKFQGAQIKSNPETERLMSMVADRNIIVKNQTDDRLLNEMKEVKKAILNKPVAIYDTDHRQIGIGNSQHQEIYLNRLKRNN